MHKLDVIVTHYKEPNEIVNRFLNSLAVQTFHDLKVTIVDDGLDCPELQFYAYAGKPFPFEIEHLKKEHKTVSAARNFGLDNTVAPYVMFCDCDDTFDEINKQGLLFAMKRIEMNGLYIYRSLIKAEAWKKNLSNALSSLYPDGEDDELTTVFQNGINSSTVHCKIYDRKFLKDYGIRFIDDLWMNEDGAFNSLAKDICSMKKFPMFDDCEFFYVWKYNANSATRQNKLYPLLGYDQFIISTAYNYKRMIELEGITDNRKINAMQFIFQAYFWLNLFSDRFIGKEGYDKYLADDIAELKKFLEEFRDCIDWKLLEDKRITDYIDKYMKTLKDCDTRKKAGFKEWISQYC